jgi:hypothetical protein
MDVKDLIDALGAGDNVQASNVFGSVMADKINSAMDDRKIEIAQSMMGGQEEQLEMDFGEEPVEEPVEEVEEDEDIQSDSDDDES